MPKITLVGAGSTVFAKNLLGDILSFPELAESTITLFDIDEKRLHTSEIVAHKVAQAVNAHPTIESTTERRRALDGADYVITMFQIGGYKPGTVIDFEIPKKYGLRQTIADTWNRGIMRGLRTFPVMLDSAGNGSPLPGRFSPNYVNPMAMNCGQLRSHHTGRRAVPQCTGHGGADRPRHPRADRGDHLPVRRHQPHGVLPQVLRRLPDGRTENLYPRSRADRRGSHPGLEPGTLRVFRRLGTS
jgi:alpha-galactosidase